MDIYVEVVTFLASGQEWPDYGIWQKCILKKKRKMENTDRIV